MLRIEADEITFLVESTHKLYKGQILKDDRGYFIGCVRENVDGVFYSGHNDDFLIAAGFNTKAKQRDLYENVLGYWDDGSDSKGWWPWCRTKENLVRILYIIDAKNRIKDTIFVDISVII